MHPSSSRAFQRHQEHDLKHLDSVDLITTKQNKLPSFIDRLVSTSHKGQSHYTMNEALCVFPPLLSLDFARSDNIGKRKLSKLRILLHVVQRAASTQVWEIILNI